MTQFRFRGSVEPSAAVARPVAVHRNQAGDTTTGGTSATIDLFDVIDSWGGWWGISAADVDAALKAAGDVDRLLVRINSPGGEALEGVAIANLLRAHPATVDVAVIGLAASAASYIATSGDTVSMAPGSMLMIHDAAIIAYGSADDFREAAANLDTVSDNIAGLYALKAGGSTETWRTAMRAETWYTADAAVAAKLADAVGLPPSLPGVEADDDADEPDLTIEVDVQVTPAALAARRFDLSMFQHVPAALSGPQPPAEQPVAPTTQPKEAGTVPDTIPTTGLRERLGIVDENADEATILAALDEALTETADTAPAAAAAVPAGHVTIDADALEELRIAARAGQEARAVQLRADRDTAIQAAIAGGHIAPARRDHWAAKWDADPEGVAASLAELTKGEPIYPVAQAPGVAGTTDGTVHEPFTDDEADALASLAGLPKGALR